MMEGLRTRPLRARCTPRVKVIKRSFRAFFVPPEVAPNLQLPAGSSHRGPQKQATAGTCTPRVRVIHCASFLQPICRARSAPAAAREHCLVSAAVLMVASQRLTH